MRASYVWIAAQEAVVATREPRMPFTMSSTLISFHFVHAKLHKIATNPPPDVALMVVMAARVATTHFWPVIPKLEPQLKPIHPHQSMNSPNSMETGEDGLKELLGRVPSKRPVRGPNIKMATSPFIPPTK
mmetsp:Transcript_23981/g.33671  ORF Transcript_23981/g.33671 Transcript_23981/m.33671 type:complete len:130 (+) Transcript_23981:940-1329(+)